MREILFKAKRIDNKEWVEGYCLEGFTGISYILVLHDHTLRVTEYCEVDPETVCQWTGLLDTNGRKVFEGDILRDTYRNEIVSVWWCEYHCHFECRGGKRGATGVPTVAQCAEVIGNIFDNPELLEVAENG